MMKNELPEEPEPNIKAQPSVEAADICTTPPPKLGEILLAALDPDGVIRGVINLLQK